MGLALFAESECAIFRAIPFRQPDVMRLFVFLQVDRPDNVGDAFAVGGKSGFIDIFERGEIFRFEWTPWLSRERA